jgi:hypothetical protein
MKALMMTCNLWEKYNKQMWIKIQHKCPGNPHITTRGPTKCIAVVLDSSRHISYISKKVWRDSWQTVNSN